MSRRYQEQIEVRVGPAAEHGVRLEGALPSVGVQTLAQDEVPTQFLWRGRVHLVRAVQAQWSQRVPWWRVESQGDGQGEVAALEHRVWRVEAGAGRVCGTGVYDLVQGERWWLERVAD